MISQCMCKVNGVGAMKRAGGLGCNTGVSTAIRVGSGNSVFCPVDCIPCMNAPLPPCIAGNTPETDACRGLLCVIDNDCRSHHFLQMERTISLLTTLCTVSFRGN